MSLIAASTKIISLSEKYLSEKYQDWQMSKEPPNFCVLKILQNANYFCSKNTDFQVFFKSTTRLSQM